MLLENVTTIAVITAITAAITAVVGVFIGLINIWKEFNRDKIKLTLIVTLKERLCLFVDVLNKSNFPIYISEIGFNNSSFWENYPQFGGKVIAPREKCSIASLHSKDFIGKDIKKIKYLYVKTACGKEARNSLKELKKKGFKE